MEGSRRSRHAPKSAVIQHAVYPPGRKIERHTSSATIGRLSVQPPVCSVQPGRSLELRTNLGLMRAKQLLQQQEQLPKTDTEPVQRLISTKSQLKTARLQPLGIVEDELISSQLCLGIIPASPNRVHRRQRPRSSTTPGVHFDLPNEQTELGRRVKVKRRSHSAILARTVNTEHLMRLLSVSKQTGFVPQDNHDDEIKEHASLLEQRDDLTRESVKQPTTPATELAQNANTPLADLPQVVKYSEPAVGMKIEVKGIRKHNETEGTVVTTHSQPKQSNPVVSSSQNSNRNSPKRTKLPPITKSVPIPKVKSAHHLQSDTLKLTPPKSFTNSQPQKDERLTKPAKSLRTNGEIHDKPTDSNESSSTSPIRVSIVSIGEKKRTDEQTKPKHKQRRSSGRLSHGWSPPQPIEPLTGSPLNTPTRPPPAVTRKRGDKDEKEEATTPVRSLNSSMLIHVNVNDFLEDIDPII